VADNLIAMIDELLFSRTGLLAVVFILLMFIMVTCVLYTLAMQKFHAIRIHDLVRETRRVRNEYLASHASRSRR